MCNGDRINEVSYVMMIKQASHFVVLESWYGVVLCSTEECWTSTL